VSDTANGKLNKLKGNKAVMLLVMLGLVAVLVGAAGYFYMQYDKQKKEVARLSNPQEAARAETEQLKSEVASLIELPSGENPTIATVVDASKLKSQAFFANAENGDRVLIFTQAKKAILYRPSTKKIIEVAPINIGENQGTTTQTNQ
jgi:hypothetical protein